MVGQLYDSGVSQAPAFKTEELKETALTGAYVNMLAHTSPKIIFSDKKVRDNLLQLFHTMIARRAFFSFPDEDEASENNPVPTSLQESRQIVQDAKTRISTYSASLDNSIADSVRNMLVSSDRTTVSFSEKAGELYEDYIKFCSYKAELLQDQEILQIELNGRAFRVARVAATWQLMQGSNELTYNNLAAAIYFAEYNSKYLDKFLKLTSTRAHRLLGDIFKSGKSTTITLDAALSQGYVSRVSTDFKELLDPMNSYLRNIGVCKYIEETKTFIYTPFEIITQEEVNKDERFSLSYSKVPGISKDDRTPYLGYFDQYVTQKSFQFLGNILKADTIYNLFEYAEGEDKEGNYVKHRRNQKNILNSTNLIVIDVDTSPVTIDIVHDYLKDFQHLIATTSDPDNLHKFRILLPVNVSIKASPIELYAYIARRVAAELLVQADPSCYNPAQPLYSYANSKVFKQERGILFDITEFISDFETQKEEVKPRLFLKSKTEGERKRKVDKILANVNSEFDYALNAPMGKGSYMLAKLSMDCRDYEFTKDEYLTVINYVNSIWQSPMPQDRLEQTLINVYAPQMHDQQ